MNLRSETVVPKKPLNKKKNLLTWFTPPVTGPIECDDLILLLFIFLVLCSE